MLTLLCLSSRVWPGRSREPHVQINLRLVPPLQAPLRLWGLAGAVLPQASGDGRRVVVSLRAGCDSWPSRWCSGAICWVPAPSLCQPQEAIDTRLALAADTKGFCFVACQQRQGLSRSIIDPGMSLLPAQPDFIHPSLPSLSRSDGQGSPAQPEDSTNAPLQTCSFGFNSLSTRLSTLKAISNRGWGGVERGSTPDGALPGWGRWDTLPDRKFGQYR